MGIGMRIIISTKQALGKKGPIYFSFCLRAEISFSSFGLAQFVNSEYNVNGD